MVLLGGLRYCHAIRIDRSIKGTDVVEVMEALKKENKIWEEVVGDL